MPGMPDFLMSELFNLLPHLNIVRLNMCSGFLLSEQKSSLVSKYGIM